MVYASRVTISIDLKKYCDLIVFSGVKSMVVEESWVRVKILVVDECGYKVGGKLMEMQLLNAQQEDYKM